MRMTASWSKPDCRIHRIQGCGAKSSHRPQAPLRSIGRTPRTGAPRPSNHCGPDRRKRDTVLAAVKDATRRCAVAPRGHP